MLLKTVRNLRCLHQKRLCSNVRTPENRMRAWQIHSYGDLGELQLSKTRLPIIASPKELLVKVEASSINPIDYMMIGGYAKTVANFFRKYELEFPLILGREFCGTILDKGQDVTDQFKVGDPIYGVVNIHKPGSHAETVIAEESLICHKPKNLSSVEAASIMYAGLTAWSALFITGELSIRNPKLSRVLVLGASGGVGTLAVQMLKSQGSTVVATCSSNAIPLVQSLGVDQTFDYADINFTNNIAEQGFYDIILDCAKFGYDKVPSEWRYNKFITLNSPLMNNTDNFGLLGGFAASAKDLLLANFAKCPQGQSVRWGFFTPSQSGIQFIDKLVKNGKINPVIHKVFKFDELPKAYECLQEGHLRGKIVIDYN